MMKALGCLVIGALFLAPSRLEAQVDFSGQWAPVYHEDNPERIPGPELGDYTGLPLNDADRQKADAWDATILSQPERQAQPGNALAQLARGGWVLGRAVAAEPRRDSRPAH